MTGPIYALSADGGSMTEYLDVNDPRWGVEMAAPWRVQGVQSVALHPQGSEIQPSSPCEAEGKIGVVGGTTVQHE